MSGLTTQLSYRAASTARNPRVATMAARSAVASGSARFLLSRYYPTSTGPRVTVVGPSSTANVCTLNSLNAGWDFRAATTEPPR